MEQSAYTPEEQTKIAEAWEETRAAEIRAGARLALTERCKGDTDHGLTRLGRWLHTAKALACIALRLTRDEARHGRNPDLVPVSLIYHSRHYCGWDAAWLEVGHGYFRNWFYEISHDSD